MFQEDLIDDLTTQVQMLEQTKLKLEMSITSLKKEHRTESAQKVRIDFQWSDEMLTQWLVVTLCYL